MMRAFAVSSLIVAGVASGCGGTHDGEDDDTLASPIRADGVVDAGICDAPKEADAEAGKDAPVSCQPTCIPGVNPHGDIIPPANGITFVGGSSHDDGFFQIGCDEEQVDVIDIGTGTVFGPYPSGTFIKYTQAPGAAPTSKKIGSTIGQAGAVLVHITGQGDAEVVQAPAGSSSSFAVCLVPPKNR